MGNEPSSRPIIDLVLPLDTFTRIVRNMYLRTPCSGLTEDNAMRGGRCTLSWWHPAAMVVLFAAASGPALSVRGESLPDGALQSAPEENVDALLDRARERLRTHPDDALRLADEALTLARRIGDPAREAAGLRVVGSVHLAQGRLDQALDHLTHAQLLFEQIGDRAGLAGALNEAGYVRTRQGNLAEALRAQLRALNLYEQIGDEDGMAGAYGGIGHVYHRQKDAAWAVHYLRRAVTLRQKTGDPRELALSYSNLGAALLDAEAFDEALQALRHTLSYSEEARDSLLTAVASNNIGVALNRLGRPDEALRQLQKALQTSEAIGNAHLSAAICDELARVYLRLGILDRALGFAHRSLEMAERTEDAVWVQNAYEVLFSIHAARGDYEQAYVHHSRYSAVKDSLFDVEKAEIVARMQARHELVDMEQQIESLHQQNRIQTLQAQQRQNALLGGLGALLLVAGFSISRYHVKQQANCLLISKNQEIEEQRAALRTSLAEKDLLLDEKEVLVREVHHRVKNNLQVLSSVLRLQMHTLESPAAVAALEDMQARIHSMALLHRELYGEDFSTHIDMQGYIVKLSQCLLRSFRADGGVNCCVHAHGTRLNADTAVPLGLILNELLSNALKHAFPDGRKGDIQIHLSPMDEPGWYEVTVADDGVGWGRMEEEPATVGLTLVRVMTRQLHGTLRRTNGVGLTTTIRFRAKGEDT